MARKLTLTRSEAESLVDLLEDCDPKEEGSWRHDLAGDIRELFGMLSQEETQEIFSISGKIGSKQ